MDLSVILITIGMHYIADFLFQTRVMAENKSQSLYWLTSHAIGYTLTIVAIPLLCAYFAGIQIGLFSVLLWVLINGILHWGVDFVTSRWGAYYYRANRTRAMFNVIGFDQFVHYACLFITFKLILL